MDDMDRGAAVMDTPKPSRVYRSGDSSLADPDAGGEGSSRTTRRGRAASGRGFDSGFDSDFDTDFDTEDEAEHSSARRSGGVRSKTGQRLFGWLPISIPRTTGGRIAAGLSTVLVIGGIVATVLAGRSFFLHDPRFVVPSASAIEITGNTHLARAEVLSVFGGDIERNIFNVSLGDRRRALEALPWVEHATVMRLLPDHLRVAIAERTPVAFVREGSKVGLVDAGGVLLSMPVNAPGDPEYSFPVVTGVNAADPQSTRAARMKLYERFTSDLDSTGEHISQKLSEVDLSDPEDVKALIPEGATDILVHFGESDFLARYQKFTSLLPEWKTQYPQLASVDMRYERQVVLEMQPGTSTAAGVGGQGSALITHTDAAAKSTSAVVPVKAAAPTLRSSARSSTALKKTAPRKVTEKHSSVKKPWVSQWRLAHPNAPPLPAGWRPGMPVKAASGPTAKAGSVSQSSPAAGGVKP